MVDLPVGRVRYLHHVCRMPAVVKQHIHDVLQPCCAGFRIGYDEHIVVTWLQLQYPFQLTRFDHPRVRRVVNSVHTAAEHLQNAA